MTKATFEAFVKEHSNESCRVVTTGRKADDADPDPEAHGGFKVRRVMNKSVAAAYACGDERLTGVSERSVHRWFQRDLRADVGKMRRVLDMCERCSMGDRSIRARVPGHQHRE